MALKSRTKIRLSALLIIVMAVMLGIYAFPQYINKTINKVNQVTGSNITWQLNETPYSLGLDLQGGTHLVYEADVSKLEASQIEDSMEGVRDVIERRINILGVSEPQVQINKTAGRWRIIAELAGIKDVNEAVKMIGETPLLEFKEVNEEPARELTAEEQTELETYNADADLRAKALLVEAASHTEDFTMFAPDKTEMLPAVNFGEIEGVEISPSVDLGYIDNTNAFYSKLFEIAEKTPIGTVATELVDWNGGLNIIRVAEKREEKEEYKAAHILICYQGATGCTVERTKEEAEVLINEIKAQAQVGDPFYTLAKEKSDESIAAETGGDLGWFAEGMMVEAFELAIKNTTNGTISEVVETDFGFHIIWKQESRIIPEYRLENIWIKVKTATDIVPAPEAWKNTELTGKHLKRAEITFDQNTNAPQISLEFSDEGADLFAQVTERNVGKPIAIFLDGQAIIDADGDGMISPGEVYAPTISEVISDGKAVISGRYTIEDAKLLKQRLNSGALPVPIRLVSQETVGATLGQESVSQSLTAGLWGLAIVALFMVLIYRLPGLVAVVALGIYGILVLSIFKAIPVTLTLAGIAGFILSIGMAVDANVLIFERLREELRLKKPLKLAIDEAFKRAWPSIFDGNMSTLITCLILSWFGTSMIKGFAITLGIGVMASMFSAVVITKVLLKVVSGKSGKYIKWLYRA